MNGPGEILRLAARKFGDEPPLVTTARTLTFADLDAASDRVAAAPVDPGGSVRGHTVSIYAQNSWQWITTNHGALKAGAVVNPVNVMLTLEELAFVLPTATPPPCSPAPSRLLASST